MTDNRKYFIANRLAKKLAVTLTAGMLGVFLAEQCLPECTKSWKIDRSRQLLQHGGELYIRNFVSRSFRQRIKERKMT